jgi:hypothetical protein
MNWGMGQWDNATMNRATETEIAGARRPFRLGDALVLMVALAVSLERFRALSWFESLPRTLGWFWQMIGQLGGWLPWHYGSSQTRQQVQTELVVSIVIELLRTCCPVLLGLTVAQPLLRLRRPRPPLEEVVRQSGFVTCVLGIVLAGLLLTIGEMWFSGFTLTLPLTRGMILCMLWPLLALPPWRREATWVDRLGRAVGWGWLAALFAGAVLEWLGWI